MINTATIFVSPSGNDFDDGLSAQTDGKGHGPLATLGAAQRLTRSLLKQEDRRPQITVELAPGLHFIESPLVFTSEDLGYPQEFDWHTRINEAAPVIYRSSPKGRAVISGGRRIEGFRPTTVNGVDAWAAAVSDLVSAPFLPTQLWINGERRYRPRLPRCGEYRIERVLDARFEGSWSETVAKGTNRFGYAVGDLDSSWKNLGDVEVEIVSLWKSFRSRITRLDTQERVAYLERDSHMRLTYDFTREGAAYVVDNVFEALSEPGQWYIDRSEALLYYIPLPGETPESVTAIVPRLDHLVAIESALPRPPKGKPLNTQPVLRFENLGFSHTEWVPPISTAMTAQAASVIPGAIRVRGSSRVLFDACSISAVGTYAAEITEGSTHIELRRCTMTDLGAGGVKIWHGTKRNTVADCTIRDGGIVFPQAVGVLVGQSAGNKVVHNEICDLYYSGISVGWLWGFAENQAEGNIVEWNHIHDLGKGKLSDMGGIYTLGPQPGTRLRYNHIHSIQSRTYGGWAIYPDEGSSDILIEYNICHDTKCALFNQHFGRDNVVRNNIFAFGTEEQISRGRRETHRSFTFERNLVYFAEGQVVKSGYAGGPFTPENALFRQNLYWNAAGGPLEFAGMSFEEWQSSGQDEGSVLADPRFLDPGNRDFRLAPDSPARDLGFVPFDVDAAGPRE